MMSSTFARFCASLIILSCISSVISDTKPSQIHISLTGRKDGMTVMWTTDQTTTSNVKYWSESSPKSTQYANGTSDYYVFPPLYESPSIHTVTLTGLQLGTKYYYQCGSFTGGWSDTYYFHTEPAVVPTPNRPLIFASIGDHGTTPDSLQLVKAMMKDEAQDPFDLLFHAGDISYANGIQKYWDIWGNMVQPFANHVPWMVAVGNHEAADLFIAYMYRFSMPVKSSKAPLGNLYYSYNYGNVHFVAVSSESVEYWHFLEQYEWLDKDLSNVDRTVTPWIVLSWHTPWYCTNHVHYMAGEEMRESFEDLLYKHKVDLVLNGHVHAYERTYPVYKGQLVADAPVYVTNGAGGNNEGHARGWHNQTVWSAFRDGNDWGFGVQYVYNNTHLRYQFKRSTDNTVLDEFWIVKNH